MPISTTLKTLSITEILEQYPQTETVFQKYGLLTYAQTRTARLENLQASALVHAIDVDKLTRELTQAIEG